MNLKRTLEVLALAGSLSFIGNIANAQEIQKIPRQIQRLEESFEFPASLKCTYESNLVGIEKDGSKLHHETLVLPKGINLEVILDKYLILFDSFGEKFREQGFSGESEADTLFVYLSPFRIKENKVSWSYELGGDRSGFRGFQNFIDNLMLNSIYKSEFDKKSTKVKINNNELLVRGPNRNNEFELTSGRSSIIYNPESNLARLKLGRAFNTQVSEGGVVSEIKNYDLDKGIVIIEDMYQGKSVLWELKLNFGNTDPNNSYTARKLEEDTTSLVKKIEKDTSKVSKKPVKNVGERETRLKPHDLKGNFIERKTAWSTGTTLTGLHSIIYGPVDVTGGESYFADKSDSLFGSHFYVEYDLDKIINKLVETNKELSPDTLRNYVKNKIPSYASKFILRKIFWDGQITEKEFEEIRKLGKDSEGFYGVWHRSENYKYPNEGAQLPFFVEIRYDIAKDTLETKVEVPDTTRIRIPEKPDTTIYRPKELPEDTLKHVTEIPDTTKKEYNFDFGVDWDSDNFYNIEFRYGKDIKYGLIFGYSPRKIRNVNPPPGNNFYGEGSETIDKFFLGAGLGIDLSKEFTFNLGAGLSIENKDIIEEIKKKSNGQVVASNTDSYVNKSLRGYAGLDFRLEKFSIGPRLGYGQNKLYSGLMARLRF